MLGALLSISLFILPAAAQESGWTGNVNLFLGAKALDEDDWSPADRQGEFGAEVDFKLRDWPVSIELDYLGASGKGTLYDSYLGTIKAESETSELNVGVRKTWDGFPHVRPFIGGGVSFAKATIKASLLGVTARGSGSGTGVWLGGGAYWTLNEAFNIGFEFRSSSVKAEIAGADVAAGGGHFGLLLGYHWGGQAKREEEDRSSRRPRRARREPSYEEESQESAYSSRESDNIGIEKQKLDLERQKLELEKEKFEFEKRKGQAAQ